MKKSVLFFIIAGIGTVVGAVFGFAGDRMMVAEQTNEMLLEMKEAIMNDDEKDDEEE